MQGGLAVHSAALEEKEALLRECAGQRVHMEAQAAVQYHQQQVTIARLEDSGACMAAEVQCIPTIPPMQEIQEFKLRLDALAIPRAAFPES